MRVLIITVGIPGSGKSTSISEKFKHCVISPDILRTQYLGLFPYKDGLRTSLDMDSEVWKSTL